MATVGRLLWQVLQHRWPDKSRLLTLTPRAVDGSVDSNWIARARFGAAVVAGQAVGRASWVLYNHLSVAQVQTVVPRAIARPYVVFLHGIEVWRPLSPRQKRVLSRAALRVANSTHTARRVMHEHPDVGVVTPCPLALPSDDTRPLQSAGAPRSKIVITVGRMMAAERYKGHDALLEAWPRVRALHPDARLVFVGGGDDSTRLSEKARVLGIAEAVTFAGFLGDEALRNAYASASIFAMPSRGEGFGLAYLEAMSYGVPCIGSIHDAAGEVIEDGVTGYLVDQDDLSGLADRISQLLGDPAARERMGAAGRARMSEHFTFDAFSRRFLGLVDAAMMPTSASQEPLARRSF